MHVDSEDKTSYLIQVSGSNYKANTLFVNESGHYAHILSSKLPQAKAFKRWNRHTANIRDPKESRWARVFE